MGIVVDPPPTGRGSNVEDSSDYISVAQAQKLLGVSKAKMSQMLAAGVLKWVPSPFDKRYRLILRADVEELAKQPRPQKKDAA